MLFNSFDFFIFFPFVVSIFFLIPHKFRWLWLLAASCYFYMAFIPIYILILFLTILVDYWAGILIERTEGIQKKIVMIISIIVTCLILFIFKYFNFFNSSFQALADFLHWNYSVKNLNIILPIGLSFHTFQSLSYVIEVYRGQQKAEKNFGIYSLYVMFFPQLVAGPIERPQNLLHQFYQTHSFDYKRVTDGLKLILWGLFKKVVIADRLAIYVDQVYNNPMDHTGAPVILATYFFAFQIFCDFSGYSDIAIGTAQVMGFNLMDNFRRPYFSKTVAEFWKRWHISLSTWFKDYIYIPMGGNRVEKMRWYWNLFFVFTISGLWHGANWTFMIWGTLHGAYLIIGLLTKSMRDKFCHWIKLDRMPTFHRYIKIIITFHLIVFAWIFFRANSFHDALIIIKNMLNIDFTQLGINIALGKEELLIAFWAIAFMEFVHLIQRHQGIRHMLSQKPALIRWSVYYCMTMSVILLGEFGNREFIYFQF